jgi:hypothetical protein
MWMVNAHNIKCWATGNNFPLANEQLRQVLRTKCRIEMAIEKYKHSTTHQHLRSILPSNSRALVEIPYQARVDATKFHVECPRHPQTAGVVTIEVVDLIDKRKNLAIGAKLLSENIVCAAKDHKREATARQG